MKINEKLLIKDVKKFKNKLRRLGLFNIDEVKEGAYKGEAIIKLKYRNKFISFLSNVFENNWFFQILYTKRGNYWEIYLCNDIMCLENIEDIIKFLKVLEEECISYEQYKIEKDFAEPIKVVEEHLKNNIITEATGNASQELKEEAKEEENGVSSS